MSASCFFALDHLAVHANRATRANAQAKAWAKRSFRRLSRREGNLNLAAEVRADRVTRGNDQAKAWAKRSKRCQNSRESNLSLAAHNHWESSDQNWADSCGRTQIYIGGVIVASVY